MQVMVHQWGPHIPVAHDKHREQLISERDPVAVERANLLNVCKLVVKELIDSSMSHGRMLDDDHVPLQQFFVVLEHILRHGIKREFYTADSAGNLWNRR